MTASSYSQWCNTGYHDNIIVAIIRAVLIEHVIKLTMTTSSYCATLSLQLPRVQVTREDGIEKLLLFQLAICTEWYKTCHGKN